MSARYCSVYRYIKDNHKSLHEVIDNLCSEHLYSNSRRSTYLIPNEKLVKKIKAKTEEEALEMLKSLIFKGTHSLDDTEDLYNLLHNKVEDLSKLHNSMKQVKLDLWRDKDTKMVYEFAGDDVPASVSVERKARGGYGMPYGEEAYDAHQIEGGAAKGSSNSVSERVRLTKLLTDEFTENPKCGIFMKKTASLVNYLKHNDKETYDSVCHLVDNNPMVTWFLLMEIGKTENLIVSNKLFNNWFETGNGLPVNNPSEIYNSCFENVVDQSSLSTINKIRKNLLEFKCSKVELPKEVVKQYKEFVSSNVSNYPVLLKEVYKNDPLLKLLQDEVRYLYGDNEFFCDNELVQSLSTIVWKNKTREQDLTICDDSLYKQLIQPKDFFLSGIFNFVNSQSLLYVPLNNEKHEKIQSTISGGSKLKYKGGNLRNKASKGNQLNLKSLISSIKSLSESERNELKNRI
jgi:hypothetical protein